MEFASQHMLLPGDDAFSEQFYEEEIMDGRSSSRLWLWPAYHERSRGLANCAKEQAEAWKEAASEEGRDPGQLKQLEVVAKECSLSRAARGGHGTRVQPRMAKGSHQFDRAVEARLTAERAEAHARSTAAPTLRAEAEEAELRRLHELGLSSDVKRAADEHYVADTFGTATIEHDIRPIVIEVGSVFTTAGFAGDDAPRCVIPTLVGRCRHQGVMIGMGQKEAYVGDEAQSKRGILTLQYPVEKGQVTNWDGYEKMLHHIFYNELRVDPEEHPVLLAVAINDGADAMSRRMEILFETFNVQACYLATSPTLGLYATGRTTGISVTIGARSISVTPVYEGYPLVHATVLADFGGEDVTSYLQKILTERGFVFTTTAERELVRDVKEKLCYAALDFETEVSAPQSEESFELPDGQCISVGNERFRAVEGLFQPAFFGHDQDAGGIHDLVYTAIMKCDVDIRKDLYNAVVLTGGTSLTSGLPDRLQKELTKLAPASQAVRVVRSPSAKYDTWIGGSIIASLSYFESMWTTKASYDAHGPDHCAQCFLSSSLGSDSPLSTPSCSEVTSEPESPYPKVHSDTSSNIDKPKFKNDVVAEQPLANANVLLLLPGDAAKRASSIVAELEPASRCQCGAVLVQTGPRKACSFCGYLPVVDGAVLLPPSYECATGAATPPAKHVDERVYQLCPAPCEESATKPSLDLTPAYIFCIDTSGSMQVCVPSSNGKTRLDCVTQAVRVQIDEIARVNPTALVTLVFFGSSVTVMSAHGHQFTIEKRLFNDADRLENRGKNLMSSFCMPIGTLPSKLHHALLNFRSSGCTSLGPALAVAVGLASGHTSSKIILCTDGAANQGVGSIQSGSGHDASRFYAHIGARAKACNSVVSVITVDGEDCELDSIGTVADITSGGVDVVDPATMGCVLNTMLEKKAVASDAQLSLIAPEGWNIIADWKSERLTTTLGCITEDRTLTAVVHPSRPSGTENITEAADHQPFQLQLEFTSRTGARLLYVRTTFVEVTHDRAKSERGLRPSVAAVAALQRAATLAHKGKYLNARIEMLSTLRLLQRAMDLNDCLSSPAKTAVALENLIGFILQGEALDGFMREALATADQLNVPTAAKRDDSASRAMYLMKTLSTHDFYRSIQRRAV